MTAKLPRIDPYLFERQFEAFRTFVEELTNVPFKSFASHPYTEKNEGYKYEIYKLAREALSFQAWDRSDIGSGDIISAAIASIEIQNSNLVPWQGRFVKNARPHQPLYEAQSDPQKIEHVEACLFRLYHDADESNSFNDLIGVFGKRYPLLAYLFFIKDRSRFLPIAPTFFDKSFKLLGAEFKTSRNCSWENYSIYLAVLNKLKFMLTDKIFSEVTLLDAHSFAWMLSCQMQKENKTADVQAYLSLSSTERNAIVKARIGQGQFRDNLIEYWSACSVTGCTEPKLLRASHIKPWLKSEIPERISLYNGLLLSPTLDACFDTGFITFDSNGSIMISSRFTENDLAALGVNMQMKLSKLEPEHQKYLEYHRQNVFQ